MQMNYFKRQISVFWLSFGRDDKAERSEILLLKSELILVPTSALPQTNSGESIPKETDGIVGTEKGLQRNIRQ